METDDEVVGRAKGGYARAEKLTPAKRREIAKRAAASRWATHEGLPRATHAGNLKIGDISIPCAVLEDGRRVLWQQGFLRALGRTGRARTSAIPGNPADGSFELPLFLSADNLKPFINNDLIEAAKPIVFRPLVGGPMSVGYTAEMLPHVCNVIMEAGDKNVLRSNQQHIYERTKILVRGLAIVGITALVDEATGYQEVRDRRALQQILDKYIGKELAKWVKTFPEDFYEQIFRLRGWEYRHGSTKRPMLMAKLTADLVYSRLAPGVLEELRRMTPKDDKGRRKTKLFQGLTTDIGHPALKDLIAGLTFLAKTHRESEWGTFYDAVNRAAPQYGKSLLLPFPQGPKEPDHPFLEATEADEIKPI
jgi:hypothetical protein